MPSPQTQAEALVILTWNQESVILSDSVKNVWKSYTTEIPIHFNTKAEYNKDISLPISNYTNRG
ncbi:hypothetical protein PIPA1_18320 [Pelosinus sp. IPA-1]|nr:hypothetical protein PIPA1_18320 [Pelosinus sp. IPA-1]